MIDVQEEVRSLSCLYNIKLKNTDIRNFKWDYIIEGTREQVDVFDNYKMEKWQFLDKDYQKKYVLQTPRVDGKEGVQLFVFDDNFSRKSAREFFKQFSKQFGQESIVKNVDKKKKAGVKI
jgi:hypothetical protein